MSPFLYLLVVEAMSINLQHLEESGDLKGLKIARGVKVSNHAQFDDDTILLGSASIQIARSSIISLDLLLSALVGNTNFEKSFLYGWNCNPKTLRAISLVMICKVKMD